MCRKHLTRCCENVLGWTFNKSLSCLKSFEGNEAEISLRNDFSPSKFFNTSFNRLRLRIRLFKRFKARISKFKLEAAAGLDYWAALSSGCPTAGTL